MRRFQTSVWGTFAAIAGIAGTLALGTWQLDRAQLKMSLAAAQERLDREPALRVGPELRDSEQLEMRRVEAYGRFEAEAMVLLDNRVRRGIVGYEVVMPLRIAGASKQVLVNRGWIAGSGDRRRIPEIVTPPDNVLVAGRAIIPGKRVYQLEPDSGEGSVWQNLSIERYRARWNMPVFAFVIQQTNEIDDGLRREWPKVDRGVDTHRSYAVQWFALAGLIAVVYVVLGFSP